MKVILVLIVLVLSGCATTPPDPFTQDTKPKKISLVKEKVRRDAWMPSSRDNEIVFVPQRVMPNGKIRAIFYLSPEDTKLYSKEDEKRLLEMKNIPDVAPELCAGIKKSLEQNQPKVDVTDLTIRIPFSPPAVLRLSRRAFPIVIEGSPVNMGIVAFRFARANRLTRIYDLTIDAAGSPIDDKTMNEIRDISAANMDL